MTFCKKRWGNSWSFISKRTISWFLGLHLASSHVTIYLRKISEENILPGMMSSQTTYTFSLFSFLGGTIFMPLLHCKIPLLSTHMSEFTLLSSPWQGGQYSCQTIRHRKGQHLTYPYSIMDLQLRVLGIGSKVVSKVWDWWVGSIQGPNNSMPVPFAICSKLRQISIILEWKFWKKSWLFFSKRTIFWFLGQRL